MDTTTYRVRLVLEVEIEAPDQSCAEVMIDDHYGRGSGGEGVNVVELAYEFE